MALEWKRGRNPYVWNSFGILEVGPRTPVTQITALQGQLETRVKHGQSPQVAGQKLESHDIAAAAKALRDPAVRALEVLLVHPETKQEGKNLKDLSVTIQSRATLPENRMPLSLVDPLAVFWFLPEPGVDAAAWPPLEDFGLVAADAPDDLKLDIVFDG